VTSSAVNNRAEWYKVPTEVKAVLPGGVVVRREKQEPQPKPEWWTGKKEG
jgi:hypothetical protein